MGEIRLPLDAIIPPAKIRDYLLVWRASGDKSGWLDRAGYRRDEWWRLAEDIRTQLLPLTASEGDADEFGDRFVIQGLLCGPSGHVLRARSVWIRRRDTGVLSLLTLVPDRKPPQ